MFDNKQVHLTAQQYLISSSTLLYTSVTHGHHTFTLQNQVETIPAPLKGQRNINLMLAVSNSKLVIC